MHRATGKDECTISGLPGRAADAEAPGYGRTRELKWGATERGALVCYGRALIRGGRAEMLLPLRDTAVKMTEALGVLDMNEHWRHGGS